MKTDSEGKLCPFCVENGKMEVIKKTDLGLLIQAVVDGAPAPGRYLMVPERHVDSVMNLPYSWTFHQQELLKAAFMHASADSRLGELMGNRPLTESMNISINQGEWTGQTVEHLHIWVIFRYDELKAGMSALIDQVRGH